jgi:hypothetical protein
MVYLLRLTVGNRSVVIVWIEGRHPRFFNFDSAYDGLLFERSVGAQVELITHGENRLIPVAMEATR